MAQPSKPSKQFKSAQLNQPQSGQMPGAQPGVSDKHLFQALRDDVAPEATPALQFLLDNAKLITTVVVLVVIAFVATIAYKWNAKNNLEKAHADVAAVVVSKEGKERVAALEALLAEVPEEMLVSVYLEIAFSADQANDFAKSTEVWGKIYKLTNNNSLKTVAGLGEAKGLAAQNKAPEALVIVEALSHSADAALLPQVRLELAMLAEKTGDLQKSKDAYEALIATNTQFDKTFLASQVEAINQKMQAK